MESKNLMQETEWVETDGNTDRDSKIYYAVSDYLGLLIQQEQEFKNLKIDVDTVLSISSDMSWYLMNSILRLLRLCLEVQKKYNVEIDFSDLTEVIMKNDLENEEE